MSQTTCQASGYPKGANGQREGVLREEETNIDNTEFNIVGAKKELWKRCYVSTGRALSQTMVFRNGFQREVIFRY